MGGLKKPKPPQVQTPPTPSPLPTPTPEIISSTNEQERRRKLALQRRGFLETLKTSQQGIFRGGELFRLGGQGSSGNTTLG